MKSWKIISICAVLMLLIACGQTSAATVVAASNDTNKVESGPGVKVDDKNIENESESLNTLSSPVDGSRGTLFFGNYPNATEVAKPLEWLVLDSKEDSLLLLAKDSIDALSWHKTRTSVTWAQSDIRVWLNGEFLNTAFTTAEQDAIILSDLNNGDDLKYGTNVGENTKDKVFLLSGAEVEKYLNIESSRTVKATSYAVSRGVYTNGSGNCAWWLRSPGMTQTSPAYIASAGNFGNRAHEVNETNIGVRPAIWVSRAKVNESQIKTSNQATVNAYEVWAKYDKSPDKKVPTYNGEMEMVTGVITYIGRDSHGTPSMEISDKSGGTSYVLGVFGSYEEMSVVSVGDMVSISGSFHIMSSENMVVIKNCEIKEIW